MATKRQVIWLQDKGKNTITREEIIGDLMGIVANYRDASMKPALMIMKDLALPPGGSVQEKLGALKMVPYPCPLARLLGIPLTVYANAQAKPGEPPSKGDPNMVAMVLTRRLEDGVSTLIKGKALVCLDVPPGQPQPPPQALNMQPDLLVKLMFFTGDLLKDTIGKLSGDTLKAKLQFAPLFFKFYGPGRHVRQQMTVLEVSDPSKGPNAPVVQSLPLEQLKAIAMQEQQKAAQNQAVARMPPFMKQPFMQNQDYINELRDIVLRGWTAPSEPGGSGAPDAAGADGEGGNDDDDDELDFSDFGKKDK